MIENTAYSYDLPNVAVVLPGRIARLDAEMRMDSLTLKGIFVRYISHEIRYYIH